MSSGIMWAGTGSKFYDVAHCMNDGTDISGL